MFTGKRLTLALAIVAAAAVMLTVLSGASVEAARGGKKGGGGGGGSGSTATLTASPNPIPLGTSGVVISGTGFANQTVYIDTGGLILTPVTTVGGSFSWTWVHNFNVTGVGTIYAYNNSSATGAPLASVMITVV